MGSLSGHFHRHRLKIISVAVLGAVDRRVFVKSGLGNNSGERRKALASGTSERGATVFAAATWITGLYHFGAGSSTVACRMLDRPRTQVSRQDLSLLKDMMNIRPNDQRVLFAPADAGGAGGVTELRCGAIPHSGVFIFSACARSLTGGQGFRHGHSSPIRGKTPCAISHCGFVGWAGSR
jgi:hypothetical protein